LAVLAVLVSASLLGGILFLLLDFFHSQVLEKKTDDDSGRLPVLSGEEREVTLYFASPDGQYLVPEKRYFVVDLDQRSMATKIFQSLKSGPSTPGSVATLPESMQLREIYISQEGMVILDLDSPVVDDNLMGVSMEKLAIYSIVNSLTYNLSDISSVRFLIDGKEAETLMGHIDIRTRLYPSQAMVKG